MKLRWKIGLGAVLAMVALTLIIGSRESDSRWPQKVEATRQALRKEGFKTELSEFNFFASLEARARTAAITNVSLFHHEDEDSWARGLLFTGDVESRRLTIVGTNANAALVDWKQEPIPIFHPSMVWTGSYWGALRGALKEFDTELDTAGAAVLSGPLRFDLNASQGEPYEFFQWSGLRTLTTIFGKRALLELRANNRPAAWTNLLVLTRLTTAWDAQPAEALQNARFASALLAYQLTWQALQSEIWTESDLAILQREWSAVDFFKNLPETAAYSRAYQAHNCELMREESAPTMRLPLGQILSAPRDAWEYYREYRRAIAYSRRGSFEEEIALLEYFRDLEVALRQTLKCATWQEIEKSPAFTNAPPRTSFARPTPGDFGQRLLNLAAEAEARRRLILAALALEQQRVRRGHYPQSLAELDADLRPNVLPDFIDGKPLRYRPTEDGHFVLYSVGRDARDDGGRQLISRRSYEMEEMGVQAEGKGYDLVWPRPATPVEADHYRKERIDALKARVDKEESGEAEAQWLRSAKRLARAETLLKGSPEPIPQGLKLRGIPLNEALANPAVLGTNKPSLEELLTLKQVVTGAESEAITFEAPILYDVLTNIGELQLYVDASIRTDEGMEAGWSECKRATNGNCLLVWNTIYETAGTHALQMAVSELENTALSQRYGVPGQGKTALEGPPTFGFAGPISAFTISNLCQFSVTSAFFNPAFGGTFRAKLAESNATYEVAIKLPNGEHVKSTTGSTTNGYFTFFWNLTDDQGNFRTNFMYDTFFDITLNDSGRRQKVRGP